MSSSVKRNPFEQRLDICHMMSTSPPSQDHVFPSLLAGSVGMIAVPGGVGITMFELKDACCVSVMRQMMFTTNSFNNLGICHVG